jgi:predicted adenine nucleotide alpha hydrolase (AANH) superfamily ATPase
VNTIIESGYELEAYSRAVVGHEYERCRHCFDLRLERTASIASRNGFDAFTTTLLISPHQKHDQIKDSGEQSARKTGTAFCYADLRKRFSDSRRQTKPMDLYRQQYCGCLYSEWERYRDG